MSNILVTNIVGTGKYDIPIGNASLDMASAGFTTLLAGVAGLTFADALAWVKDNSPAAGGEGTRSLCCYIRTYEYVGSDCPSQEASAVMLSSIKHELEDDVEITSVGAQYIENMRSYNPV